MESLGQNSVEICAPIRLRFKAKTNTITTTRIHMLVHECADRSHMTGSMECTQMRRHQKDPCQKTRWCGTWAVLVSMPFTLFGCAIHHYDKESGVEHIWGFGHMKLKVAQPEGPLQAIVHGTDVFGLSVGSAKFEKYASLGLHSSQYIDIHKQSTQFLLEWRGDDFTHVHVGFDFPMLKTRPVDTETEKMEQE